MTEDQIWTKLEAGKYYSFAITGIPLLAYIVSKTETTLLGDWVAHPASRRYGSCQKFQETRIHFHQALPPAEVQKVTEITSDQYRCIKQLWHRQGI